MSDKITVTIDGKTLALAPGITILQACEAAGVEVPRFCYHERLSIAGNCRMCLVEVENAPKPVASCAMPIAPDMTVHTKSDMVKQAREGVMEFLLINHPLDCPICDQGGECDLQDQALGFGGDYSRFDDNKRAVEEKNMGPLIKTVMTRCIHCTRCVRFAHEVAGTSEIGAIGRGEDMEITALSDMVMSELSGNVIDLCPVGALTSKPFAFTARSWELRKTETIDVMDAMGAHIRVDARGREIMRIMPRACDDINEEWLGDKSRFVWDGLNRQRLDTPYVRKDGKLTPVNWDEAFSAIAARVKGKGDKVAAIAGDLACAESLQALKDLMNMLGSPHMDCRQDGAKLSGPRGHYLFNSGIAGIDVADAILLIGTNPRLEASVLNARIRKRWLEGGIEIGLIGKYADLTYELTHIGESADLIDAVASGGHAFSQTLKRAKRPMVIVGQGALMRSDGESVLSAALNLADKMNMVSESWNGFNILHDAAARVAGLDLGVLPGEGGLDCAGILSEAQTGTVETVLLLGADEIDMQALDNAFTIYIGTHGDAGAHAADVILPGATYTEKQALYVNMEGRVQMTSRAVFPPGEAREEWKILRALSAYIGAALPYDNVDALRAHIYAQAPHFDDLNARKVDNNMTVPTAKRSYLKKALGIKNNHYYQTNPIARASHTLAQCAQLKSENKGIGNG